MKRAWIAALALICASATAQAPAPASSVDKLLAPDAGPSAYQGVIGVVLSGNNANAKLEPSAGSIGTTYAFVTALIFADFPDLHATVRTTDTHPVVRLLMGGDPSGRVFIVKVNANDRTNNRSVKMGKAGFASYSGITQPDPDWTIPYSAQQTKPGYWTLTLDAPLPPGEYGVFAPPGVMASGTSSPGGTLYGFGVDAAHLMRCPCRRICFASFTSSPLFLRA